MPPLQEKKRQEIEAVLMIRLRCLGVGHIKRFDDREWKRQAESERSWITVEALQCWNAGIYKEYQERNLLEPNPSRSKASAGLKPNPRGHVTPGQTLGHP